MLLRGYLQLPTCAETRQNWKNALAASVLRPAATVLQIRWPMLDANGSCSRPGEGVREHGPISLSCSFRGRIIPRVGSRIRQKRAPAFLGQTSFKEGRSARLPKVWDKCDFSLSRHTRQSALAPRGLGLLIFGRRVYHAETNTIERYDPHASETGWGPVARSHDGAVKLYSLRDNLLSHLHCSQTELCRCGRQLRSVRELELFNAGFTGLINFPSSRSPRACGAAQGGTKQTPSGRSPTAAAHSALQWKRRHQYCRKLFLVFVRPCSSPNLAGLAAIGPYGVLARDCSLVGNIAGSVDSARKISRWLPPASP